jgi:hypothetical protein
MILIRSLLIAALAYGMSFASGQQNTTSNFSLQAAQSRTSPILPPAMASAVDRLAEADALNPLPALGPNAQWFVMGQGPNIVIGQAPQTIAQCSIPLAQTKIPDKPTFFMRTAPAPKDSADAMPVLKAPVCPIAPAK